MKKRNFLLFIVIVLAVVLLLLACLALHLSGESEKPPESTDGSLNTAAAPSTQTDPSGSEPEDTAATEPDNTAATEPDSTAGTEPEPTEPAPLYTRAELEAMDTTVQSYGPGLTSGGKRAPYAESDQKKYGQYGANFIAPDNGNIYLTFDCGYEYIATDENGGKYRVTERILDVLKEKNVKAVFFVTMYYVKDQPDLVQRMIDEGHAVGNHSNNHPNMPEQTIDKMIYEVTSLHEYVLEQFGYEMHLFRPPTGSFSVQSLAVVQNLGYQNVHWSFAYADWDPAKQPDTASAYKRVTTSAHSGAIYLLHAVSTTNAAILADAIDYFLAEGYHLELFQ